MQKQQVFFQKNQMFPLFVGIGLAFLVLFLCFFYLTYAQNAWFFQDDFGFIAYYADSLRLGQLLDFGNFGRFVSRNLYWHYGIKLFSYNAQYFYLLNFFVIATTAFLIYKIMSERLGKYAGGVAGLFYFSLPATIKSYAWLSNSQHILGHFFVVLFVFFYMKNDASYSEIQKRLKVVVLSLVLMLGFLSNIFMSMVLTLPIWMLLVDKERRKEKLEYFLVLFGVVVFGCFYLHLSSQQTGAYSTSYSFETVVKNASFYFGGNFLVLLWMTAVVSGAAYAYFKKQFLTAWFFIASVAFFLPFAFFMYQRYGQYAVLSHLFFLLGVWSLLIELLSNKWMFLVKYIGLLMLFLVFLASLSPIRYFSKNPNGRIQKNEVEQLRFYDLNHPSAKNYCFCSDKVSENKAGVQVWDIPGDWWFVGFGKAFSLFVNPEKTFELSSDSSTCDATFVFKNGQLQLH